MKLKWLTNVPGRYSYQPKWEVTEVLVHTLEVVQPDKTKKLVQYLVVRVPQEELHKLVEEFKHCIDFGILGVPVFELEVGKVIWKYKAPKGYERSIKDEEYVGFKVLADDKGE